MALPWPSRRVRRAVRAGRRAGGRAALFQINLFWIIVAAANFVVFFAARSGRFAFKPVAKMLGDRRARIEQGLKDAEAGARDRESAEQERLTALAEARREANEILARAQKVAQETRDADIAATRDRARADARARGRRDRRREAACPRRRCAAEVADLALAAAGRVVGETMTDERQRRLVEEFLAETGRGRPRR